MALQPSWPGVTGLASTTAVRKDLAGLIETDTSGVARAGVFPAHLNALVTARSDMNVDIAAFQAAAVQFGGPVLISNDGTIQLPSVLVSPASGTNYYVVYVKQNESTSPGTDANNNVVAGVTLSTVSFAAARGALPTGALEFATVQMPSGKTATNASGVTITPTFQYTAAEGGVVLLRNQTEQDAWGPAEGAVAYRIDADWTLQRINGVWKVVGGVTPYADGAVATATIGGAAWITLALTGVAGSGVENSGGAGRLTVKQAGRYRFTATAVVAASSYGQGRFRKNGSDSPAVGGVLSPIFASPSVGGVAYPFAVWEVDMAVDDWVEFQIVSNNGGSLSGGTVQAAYLRPVA